MRKEGSSSSDRIDDRAEIVEQRLFTKWAVVLITGLFSIIAWFASDTYKHVTDPTLTREIAARLETQQSVINSNVIKIAVLEEKVDNIQHATMRTEESTTEILRLIRRSNH